MASKWMLFGAVSAAALVTAPVASAADYEYVRTVSGAVRCVISSEHVGCERVSADGFPGAPPSQSGMGHYNVAGVEADGTFNYSEGNIGTPDEGDLVLDYGRAVDINGWTVMPSFDGTHFTNDSTGRGMFVSIDGVTPY